jgi:tetratricopeptide (TPR) repeat protein
VPSATTPAATLAGTGCSAGQNQPALDVSDFDQYPQAIQDFLNNGGTPSDLDEALYNAGVANQPVAVKTADMTGDGQAEVVVSIFDPASQVMPPSGKLMIYTCNGGAYQLAYQEESPEAWGAPGIRYLQDLNADGKSELIESEGSCGAHTCFEDVKIIAWDGEGFKNLFEGSSKEIPYPDIRITDADGDGIFDVEIAGSGYGSVGAGPQRNVIDIWKYDPSSGTWKFDKEVLQDSNYRIHVLHDAETAAKNGDYAGALELYDRVINDPSLEDWMDPETEKANLSAYVLFKTGVIYTVEGQQDQANAAFEQLSNQYPQGVPQHAYVEMANAFQQAYASDGLEAACTAAKTYASEHADQVLAPLGPQAFGYANREFTPDDVCPE